MFGDLDIQNISKRLKLIEDRMGYYENCQQIQEKKILELSRSFDQLIRQIQDLNLGTQRDDEKQQNQISRIEKELILLQKDMQLLEKNSDEKINQLIQQLVEPSLKDIDYQIKQESNNIRNMCTKQIGQVYDELNNRIKNSHQQQSNQPSAQLQQSIICKSNNYEDVKRKIDDEIERRIGEENEKRRNALESEHKQHRSGQMSTEKSKAREIQNRLNLERKAKQDKINQLNELYQFRKH